MILTLVGGGAHRLLGTVRSALKENVFAGGGEIRLYDLAKRRAQAMAAMKTKMKLALDASDAAVADLITDGCNMGVKSLSKYLNQYAAADESSKALCLRLIEAEEALAVRLRDFL